MCSLYESILSLCTERGIKGGKMCADLGLSKSLLTDLKAGRKKGITADTAQKIADYFGVSVDRVLGKEKAPTPEGERKPKLRSVARLESSDITPEMDKNIADYIDFLLKRKEGQE